ncbi:MAG TPA: OsmC family protein [Bacteroidales bacterium]|jgi:putative redox protein|nr:OsmC family protein [Bacteroidales bacterium]
MEKHIVKARWLGKKAFEGDIDGHKIIVDTREEKGGENRGPSPKRLMLMSLAGCTGMDVASILVKMREDLRDLNITVEGDLTEEHPKHYNSMHVIYEFTGKNLNMDNLRRAVDLSEQKYCGVMAVYKKVIRMSSEIRIIEVK